MKPTLEKINQVLAEWNPIGVPDDIAESEYSGYVFPVFMCIYRNKPQQVLEELLVYILSDSIGLRYDPADPAQVNAIRQLALKLIDAYRNTPPCCPLALTPPRRTIAVPASPARS